MYARTDFYPVAVLEFGGFFCIAFAEKAGEGYVGFTACHDMSAENKITLSEILSDHSPAFYDDFFRTPSLTLPGGAAATFDAGVVSAPTDYSDRKSVV